MPTGRQPVNRPRTGRSRASIDPRFRSRRRPVASSHSDSRSCSDGGRARCCRCRRGPSRCDPRAQAGRAPPRRAPSCPSAGPGTRSRDYGWPSCRTRGGPRWRGAGSRPSRPPTRRSRPGGGLGGASTVTRACQGTAALGEWTRRRWCLSTACSRSSCRATELSCRTVGAGAGAGAGGSGCGAYHRLCYHLCSF